MGSFVRVYDDWIESGIGHSAFRLLCLIAAHAGPDGVCRMKPSQLARMLNVRGRMFNYSVAELTKACYVKRRYDDADRRRVVGFELCPGPVSDRPAAPAPAAPGGDGDSTLIVNAVIEIRRPR